MFSRRKFNFFVQTSVHLCLLSIGSNAHADLTSFGWTVRNVLPQPEAVKAQAVTYPVPGQILLSFQLMQGDYDVSHFSQQHPSMVFANGDHLTLVLGYWIHTYSSSSNNLAPTTDTWIPLGYGRVPNPQNGGVSNIFRKINNTGTTTYDGYTLMKESIDDLISTIKQSFVLPGQTSPQFQLHYGIMVSSDLADTKGTQPSQNYASSTDIARAYSSLVADIISSNRTIKGKSLANLGSDQATIDKNLADLQKFSVTHTDTGLSVAFSSSGSLSISDDPLFLIAKDLLRSSSFESISDSTKSSLMKIYNRLKGSESSGCSNLLSDFSGYSTTTKFWWEPFPMNLTCKTIYGGGEFVTAYDTFKSDSESAAASTPTPDPSVSPSPSPSPSSSSSVSIDLTSRNNLAALLLGAAIIQKAQSGLSNSNRPTANVFGSSPYINKVLASTTIPIRLDSNKVKTYQPMQSVHPESFFAIRDYPPYFTGSLGDRNTTWMNRGDINNPDFTFSVGDPAINRISTTDFTSTPLNLTFRLRSLNSSKGGSWFCEKSSSKIPAL